MKGFTNENVIKEYKRLIKSLIIGIILIGIAFGLFFVGYLQTNKIKKAAKSINEIILDKDLTKKEDIPCYLDVKAVPYLFAENDENSLKFYILDDGEYYYVGYMNTDDYKKLSNKNKVSKGIRIYGITKKPETIVKELAIDAYNEGLEDDKKITILDYDVYFGDVYIDLVSDFSDTATIYYLTGILFALFGGILTIETIVKIVQSNKNAKEYSIDELEKEMNTGIYYPQINMYLTENYIINLKTGFKAFNYSDVLWVYPVVHRYNGVKSNETLKILASNGKYYDISNISAYNNNQKEARDDLLKRISEKNEKILVGYTTENIHAMQQKLKEIKQEKKNAQ